MTTNQKIDRIRDLMKNNNVNAIIIPSSDPHMSEYVSDHWRTRAYVSGFSGSAGSVLITDTMSGLWTDGRYYVQAANELKDSEVQLFKAMEVDCPSITKYLCDNLKSGDTVGINGKIFSVNQVNDMKKDFDKKDIKLVSNVDFGNDIWEDRPVEELTPVYVLEEKYSGKSVKDKLEDLRKELADKDADSIVIGMLDHIAWLFNIRANDVECNPVVISYAFITKDKAILFTDSSRISNDVIDELKNAGIELREYNEIYDYVTKIDEKLSVLVDTKNTNFEIYNGLKENNNVEVVVGEDPILLMKACKNDVEVKNLYEAYKKDACALAEFYGWLYECLDNGEKITEWTASEKLQQFRAEQETYKGDSFTAIIAYKENAAMMHYAPKADTAKVLEKSNLLLNDSGGQYLFGTTDTTRTFALGEITDEERRDFTLVLQAVIALSSAKFKEGTTGSMLDVLSRQKLWNYGLDYRCGTGHGVGYLLNVHEGPQSFGNKDVKLKEGMILTVEPGVYTENSHGIRTENTVVVVKDEKTEYGQFYKFNCFTLVPIDTSCLDIDMMKCAEVRWLNEYHQKVYETISPLVSDRAKKWLEVKTKPITKCKHK